MMDNNQISVLGKMEGSFWLNHVVYGEYFYSVTVVVRRLSGYEDKIHVIISERLIDVSKDYAGKLVKITGELHSYNRAGAERKHLDIFVFAHDVEFPESESYFPENKLHLNGYLCRKPIYRRTPLGKEIADVLVAVNRSYGKSDYIPCICWGSNAKYVARLEVGTHVDVQGRIQSREYIKRYDNGREECRIAYEVSVNRISQELL